jgi:lysyl-tRNA synthetase class II
VAKRFPDRVEIAAVRAEAEQLEPGDERGDVRRVAGRVMARRDMGKLVFLDLVDFPKKSRRFAARLASGSDYAQG